MEMNFFSLVGGALEKSTKLVKFSLVIDFIKIITVLACSEMHLMFTFVSLLNHHSLNIIGK